MTRRPDLLRLLSKAERRILPHALLDTPLRTMSRDLHLSRNTISSHLRRIYAKLDVSSRGELILLFALLPPPTPEPPCSTPASRPSSAPPPNPSNP